MSGDDDGENESQDLRMSAIQSIQDQPVGGSTFAQKNAAFILGAAILFGKVGVMLPASILFLAVMQSDAMLNLGRGKRTRISLWGKQQEEQPAVDLLFPKLRFAWAGAYVVACCAWLVTSSPAERDVLSKMGGKLIPRFR